MESTFIRPYDCSAVDATHTHRSSGRELDASTSCELTSNTWRETDRPGGVFTGDRQLMRLRTATRAPPLRLRSARSAGHHTGTTQAGDAIRHHSTPRPHMPSNLFPSPTVHVILLTTTRTDRGPASGDRIRTSPSELSFSQIGHNASVSVPTLLRHGRELGVGIAHLISAQTPNAHLIDQHSASKPMIDNPAAIG